MDDEQLAELVWQRMQQMAPFHEQCGTQFKLGGLEGVGPMLVCLECSYFETPSQLFMDGLLQRANDAVKASMS